MRRQRQCRVSRQAHAARSGKLAATDAPAAPVSCQSSSVRGQVREAWRALVALVAVAVDVDAAVFIVPGGFVMLPRQHAVTEAAVKHALVVGRPPHRKGAVHHPLAVKHISPVGQVANEPLGGKAAQLRMRHAQDAAASQPPPHQPVPRLVSPDNVAARLEPQRARRLSQPPRVHRRPRVASYVFEAEAPLEAAQLFLADVTCTRLSERTAQRRTGTCSAQGTARLQDVPSCPHPLADAFPKRRGRVHEAAPRARYEGRIR
eukprot:CAMPEP_0119360560 /NCGR_PEP_ID=MMETSP1334-20130426/8123_1 /TAXON_ID=127549 /ORGANISM="Calcidiscus leptoporus, Strain RCC1130" /LENGTH=260 /DNA_ID=CAMNT_0007375409 /DNA_START=228 /DNA_END=1010 /DNA_ORIENTATION=+